LSGGADLRSVQALLGHESVATTEVYTLVTKDALRSAHEKTHPRG
jgi:integrase/recombinase XerD